MFEGEIGWEPQEGMYVVCMYLYTFCPLCIYVDVEYLMLFHLFKTK